MTIKNLKAVMADLAHRGYRESYEDLWKAVTVLWNLGLIGYGVYRGMVREDHRLYESGEMNPMMLPKDTSLDKVLAELLGD